MQDLEFQKSLLKCQSEASLDGILVTAIDGKILSYNQRFTELWKLPPHVMDQRDDQVAVDYVLDLLKDPRSFQNRIRELYHTETETSTDELELTDGRTIQRYSAPIRNEADTFLGRVWFFRCITKERQAEKERLRLLESERLARREAENQRERLRSLFMKAPALMAIVRGPDLVLEFVNEQVDRLVGGRSLVDKTFAEALPGVDSSLLKIMHEAYDKNEGFSENDYAVSADWLGNNQPSQRYFNFIIEPLHSSEGERDGLWMFALDVTEHKELEARLRTSEQMAALGTLAAGVAHEINNPLTAVWLHLEKLSKDLRSIQDSQSSQAESLLGRATDIEKGLERVRKIVQDLMLFSRSSDESITSLEVHPILDSCVKMAEHEIRHRARLIKNYSKLQPVPGNETRLAQVFLNLLVNAAQSIPEGNSDQNSIQIKTYMDQTDRAIIEISDTGCGLSPETKRQIFQPFFTTKAVGSGTGLGLSICHGILQRMGGEISVVSKEGQGSTFRVVLPTKALKPKAPLPPPERPQTAPLSTQKRLLVIDDEPDLLNLISEVLRDHHHIEIARDGQEALEIIQSRKEFDLILCDLMMPKKTGMDFYYELQDIRPDLEKKIIFLTGGAFTTRAAEFMKKVENDCLQKPFTMKELHQKIDQFLETC